jgi:hypothetical protein
MEKEEAGEVEGKIPFEDCGGSHSCIMDKRGERK